MLNAKDKRRLLDNFMLAQNNMCYYCKTVCFIGTIEQRINKDSHDNIATIEHLLSRWNKETNYKKNLVMACNKCNKEQGNKIIREYKK